MNTTTTPTVLPDAPTLPLNLTWSGALALAEHPTFRQTIYTVEHPDGRRQVMDLDDDAAHRMWQTTYNYRGEIRWQVPADMHHQVSGVLYELKCEAEAEAQGTNHIIRALAAVGIEAVAEQSGGFMMTARWDAADGRTFVAVTEGETHDVVSAAMFPSEEAWLDDWTRNIESHQEMPLPDMVKWAQANQ